MALDHDTILRLLLADRVKLMGFIRVLVHDPHLAEDVFQEVSILALGKSEQILDEPHLLGWVRQAARLTALSMLRKRGRRGLPLDDAVLEVLEAEWQRQDRTPSLELLGALEECMAKLTPRARRILELRYTRNLVGPQLAAALQQPITTVYVALSRAHRAMEQCIRQQLRTEEAR